MSLPLILPLEQCHDPRLVGGKAANLALLLKSGFHVPPGLCVTTEAYHAALSTTDSSASRWHKVLLISEVDRRQLLTDCQKALRNAECSDLIMQILEAVSRLEQPPDALWAVRSSATNEDTGGASFAGLYRTHLGVSFAGIESAIKDVWASLWDERVVEYLQRQRLTSTLPTMAVVIQPLLEARVAGVAYSAHPLTRRTDLVMINAVPGLAASLVGGKVAPDQYVLGVGLDGKPASIIERTVAHKTVALRLEEQTIREINISPAEQDASCLTDTELIDLACQTKKVEQVFGKPIDIEWVIEDQQLWVVQARPIAGLPRLILRTNDDCEWSRANFKETLPELPSPLGLSFLERFMDRYIIGPYRRLGCTIPEGVTAVRILHGRPYINMTLFYSLVSQLRGNPSLMTEQMGGEAVTRKPEVQPLGLVALVRAGWVMMSEMRKAVRRGPHWFAEMKELAAVYRGEGIERAPIESLTRQLGELEVWLETHEVTFAIAGGVSQCLQALGTLLPRWLGDDWRSLLNATLQGQGTVISAQQIGRLADLARLAREEPEVWRGFTDEKATLKKFREVLKGTAFLRAFDVYLEDYGHRGVGESDIMSPRFTDEPEQLLSIVRTQLLTSPHASPSDILGRASVRDQALGEIRNRFGWRLHRRAVFAWWYRRLCRFFALREANRHHLMHYSTAVRTILLRVGELMKEHGVFKSHEDIFFLTLEEQVDLLHGRERNWQGLIGARRTERERHASHTVPDTIRYWDGMEEAEARPDGGTETLRGIPISAGSTVGPARLVRSIVDWDNVKEGDIIVTSVIDPGMTPLFILAKGLVAEMGGTLSHGAIIAREYGLPAVVNVTGAMTRIRDGDVIVVDAKCGAILFQPDTAVPA